MSGDIPHMDKVQKLKGDALKKIYVTDQTKSTEYNLNKKTYISLKLLKLFKRLWKGALSIKLKCTTTVYLEPFMIRLNI